MSDVAMNEMTNGSEADEQDRRRRRRSNAIACSLAAMAIMFFAVTIIQLKGKVAADRFKAIKGSKGKVISTEPAKPKATGTQ